MGEQAINSCFKRAGLSKHIAESTLFMSNAFMADDPKTENKYYL